MRYGRDLTHDVSLEPRQYELLGIDLGDGLNRMHFAIILGIAGSWVALLWLITGGPNQVNMLLFLLPPSIVIVFGLRKNDVQPRRANLTQWVLKGRQFFSAHRPIVNLGRTKARRQEFIPLTDRADMHSVLRSLRPVDNDEQTVSQFRRPRLLDFHDRPVGRLIHTNRRATRLYWDDAAASPHERRNGKES